MIQYAAAIAISVAVAAFELISRYRDSPTLALYSAPGLGYIAVNGAAGAAALAVADSMSWAQEISPVARGALASLAALVLMRSALFIVRVGLTDISVGPNSVLEILLEAADRHVNRTRAAHIAELVSRLRKRQPST